MNKLDSRCEARNDCGEGGGAPHCQKIKVQSAFPHLYTGCDAVDSPSKSVHVRFLLDVGKCRKFGPEEGLKGDSLVLETVLEVGVSLPAVR